MLSVIYRNVTRLHIPVLYCSLNVMCSHGHSEGQLHYLCSQHFLIISSSSYSPYLVKGSRLFTASGAQYYHLFNISLCGQTAAVCTNNVSYQVEGQTSQVSC